MVAMSPGARWSAPAARPSVRGRPSTKRTTGTRGWPHPRWCSSPRPPACSRRSVAACAPSPPCPIARLLSPEHDQARALLAWSDYFLGDYRGAVVGFKAGLQRQPTWEGLYNGLGWSRLRLGRYHLAVAAFRPALERNPEYLDALHGLGS